MEKPKKNNLGVTIVSLGGLATIFSLTTFKDGQWGLILAIAGVVLCLLGLYLINKEKRGV